MPAVAFSMVILPVPAAKAVTVNSDSDMTSTMSSASAFFVCFMVLFLSLFIKFLLAVSPGYILRRCRAGTPVGRDDPITPSPPFRTCA